MVCFPTSTYKLCLCNIERVRYAQMKQPRIEFLISLVNWAGIASFIIYMLSMLVIPLIKGGFSWTYLQGVWDTWQGLNVGVLAFISSVIALNISRWHAHDQRKRDFVAAKAFLPEALSELTTYFIDSASVFMEGWERVEQRPGRQLVSLTTQISNLPDNYKAIFANCIRFADAETGRYLAYILMLFQVHHARLRSFSEAFGGNSQTLVVRENIVIYLYRLGELQALINKLFDFARGLEEFQGSELTRDDFHTAYHNLNIWPGEFSDLEAFTRREIERGREQT